jgi:predicted Rossmann fold nucleotide-binding protein DprA/Smf involved in DNA uptake
VPGSPGCDELIATGAEAIDDDGALLERLAGRSPATPDVPAALAAVVGALKTGAAAPGELARRMGTTLPATLALLAEAELVGWARRLPGGKFEVLRAN